MVYLIPISYHSIGHNIDLNIDHNIDNLDNIRTDKDGLVSRIDNGNVDLHPIFNYILQSHIVLSDLCDIHRGMLTEVSYSVSEKFCELFILGLSHKVTC